MRACDLLITKPGGLTVSEALACNIPLAVFDAIPGQEEDNADFSHLPQYGPYRWIPGKHCAEVILHPAGRPSEAARHARLLHGVRQIHATRTSPHPGAPPGGKPSRKRAPW